jgi:hypothetical protein
MRHAEFTLGLAASAWSSAKKQRMLSSATRACNCSSWAWHTVALDWFQGCTRSLPVPSLRGNWHSKITTLLAPCRRCHARNAMPVLFECMVLFTPTCWLSSPHERATNRHYDLGPINGPGNWHWKWSTRCGHAQCVTAPLAHFPGQYLGLESGSKQRDRSITVVRHMSSVVVEHNKQA